MSKHLLADLPYDDKDKAKALAKRAGGRLQWDASEKKWYFIGATLPASLQKYAGGSATSTAGPKTASKAAKRVHVLDVPFDSRGFAGSFGARWSGKHGVTVFEGDDLPAPLRHYRSAPHSWERWQECEINGVREMGAPGTKALTPRDHQHEPIELILKVQKAGRCGFLLADDVGVGKTYTALFALQQMPGIKTVLIICPLDVVPAWRRVITELGSQGKRFIVITPGQAKKLLKVAKQHQDKVKTNKGLIRYGQAMAFDALVLDEAHLYRNPTSQRSKIAAKLQAQAKFTLWLSATAGQTPLELSYLAPLMAEVTGARISDLAEWEKWCASQKIQVKRGDFGKWEWEPNEDDIERMRALLFGGKLPAGIRRTPQDIQGWPEVQDILTPVDLGPAERDLYEAAWSEFREDLGLDRKRGRDADHALVRMLRFRQKSSLLRTGGTVEKAISLLENGHQVAISVEFHETLNLIKDGIEAQGYECAIVHGKLSKPQREREIDSFQTGQRKVVLFTPKEGLSFHQLTDKDPPRSTIIHDLRWSGIDMVQIRGRTHRDGKNALQYWMFAQDTIEEQIAEVVLGRVANMKAMQGDDTDTIREIEQALLKLAA